MRGHLSESSDRWRLSDLSGFWPLPPLAPVSQGKQTNLFFGKQKAGSFGLYVGAKNDACISLFQRKQSKEYAYFVLYKARFSLNGNAFIK